MTGTKITRKKALLWLLSGAAALGSAFLIGRLWNRGGKGKKSTYRSAGRYLKSRHRQTRK